MNESEKNHLSAETLEAAVLERLAPEELAAVESHIRGCTRCRIALEDERLVAAATKGWARAAMKQKLARQIAAASQRHVPWPHVLGAAALVVVIVGVGVLFRWREPVPERDLIFSDTAASDALQKDMPPPPAPTTLTDKVPADHERSPLPHDQRESTRRDKKDIVAADRQMRAEPPEAEEKSKEAQPAVMKAATAEEAAEPAGLDLWLGGTEVGNAPSGGMQTQPAGASNQGVSLNRLEARKGTRKPESSLSSVFVIDQRPRRALDDGRADMLSTDIPTHIVQSGDTLRVVLFLDPLLTPDQMRVTFARQVSADSFQVVLPDRILGYRIPQNVTR